MERVLIAWILQVNRGTHSLVGCDTGCILGIDTNMEHVWNQKRTSEMGRNHKKLRSIKFEDQDGRNHYLMNLALELRDEIWLNRLLKLKGSFNSPVLHWRLFSALR
jgi:hypothetical protein